MNQEQLNYYHHGASSIKSQPIELTHDEVLAAFHGYTNGYGMSVDNKWKEERRKELDKDMVFYDLNAIDEMFHTLMRRFPAHKYVISAMAQVARDKSVAMGPSEFASFLAMRFRQRMHLLVGAHLEDMVAKDPIAKNLEATLQVQVKLATDLQQQVMEQTAEINRNESDSFWLKKHLEKSDITLEKLLLASKITLEFPPPPEEKKATPADKDEFWRVNHRKAVIALEEPEPIRQAEPPVTVKAAPESELPSATQHMTGKAWFYFAMGVSATYLLQAFVPILRI